MPNGFVLLSNAYDQYVYDCQIEDKIKSIILNYENGNDAEKEIKKLFLKEKMTTQLISIITDSYNELNCNSVAVRSSATVEDLPGMSFAGQYSSYLNVKKEDLIDNVIQCWQSLWNARAIDYRRKHQLIDGFSHAVVIQEMVEAEKSGVLFTANPMSGKRDEVVINASFGLGEAIVSGDVNPDQYQYNKSTGEIIQQTISDKLVEYTYGERGIVKKTVSSDKIKSKVLTDLDIVKLIDAAKKIENYYGNPQDVEFAFDERNELYLLQSREITTLFPTNKLDHDDKLRAYLSAGTVLFGMKEPFTPMGFDIMSNMFPTIINVMTQRKKKPLKGDFVKHEASRMYIDMTYLLSSKFVAKQFGKAFSGNDLPLKEVIYDIVETYGRTFTKQGIRFKMPLGIMKYAFSMVGKASKISKIANADRYDAMMAVGNEACNNIYKRYEALTNTEERVCFASDALVEAFKLSQTQAMYCLDVNNMTKIEKIIKKEFGNEFKPEILVQSLPRCFTQTMMVKLNEYAKFVDENNLTPAVEHDAFQEILEIYGHRGNLELDLGTKRWREDPSYLLGLTKSYLTDKMYQRNLEDYDMKRIEAEKLIDIIYRRLLESKGKRKAESVKKLMVNYRYGAAMREYPKSDIVRFLALGRAALLSVGQELYSNNKIEEVEDVFYLYKEELLKGENLKDLVNKNKAYYQKEYNRKAVPRIVLNNGETYYSSRKINPNANTIQGLALSPGTYEGIIRVVIDPVNTDLKEGEVMVTESTNPAWTPLFATAGALIMEYGGPVSHGGIVAREYGIPAVVGISIGELQDGQRVRVNGENGVVEIL